MSTHTRRAAPRYPDAEPVDAHLVVDRTDWIPGRHPEPERRYDGQRAYRERYYRCIRCGIECVSLSDFPPECDGVR